MQIHRLILLTALAVALPSAALAAKPPGARAGTSAISPAYARDLGVIIQAWQYYEMLFEAPLKSDLDPAKREFIEFFRKEATREELLRRFTPGLASVLNPQLASRIARLVDSPVFSKNITLMRQKQDDANKYTPEEEAELSRIWNDPAMKEFAAVVPKVNASLGDTFKRWNADLNQQMAARVTAIYEKLEQDLEAARIAGDGRIVTIGSTGYAAADDFINAFGGGIVHIFTASDQFEEAQTRVGYSDYFGMRKLVDGARRAEANHAIDQVEQAWAATQTQYDAAFGDFEGSLSNTLLASNAALKQRTSKLYAQMRGYIDAQDVIMRRALAQHREIVMFMQANQDGIRLKGGALVFANKEIRQRATELDDKFYATIHELEDNQARLEAAIHAGLSEMPGPLKKPRPARPAKKT